MTPHGEMIERLTMAAYENGASSIAVAETVIAAFIAEQFGRDAGDRETRVIARQLAGILLEAGWRPPDTGTEPNAGTE